MKKLVLTIFAVAALTSCKKETESTEPGSTMQTDTVAENTAEKNIASLKMMIQDLNNGDVSKISDYVADESTDYGNGLGEPHVIPIDSLIINYKMFLKMIPDMKSSNQEYYVGDNNKIAMVSTFTGTWTGDNPKLGKATGKSFKFKDCDIYEFNDEGKIISHSYIYPDKMFLENIGATMPE